MNMKLGLVFCAGILTGLHFMCINASAQVPADFPQLDIVSNGPVAPGDFIGTIGWRGRATNTYEVVLDNSGSPLFANETNILWRTVTPSGLIAEKGNHNNWNLKDESFKVVDSFSPGNGYSLDGHDFELLPNGHALILESEEWPVDMSKIIPGGRPDAVLKSVVFQEIDANKQVVFQWRARDHLAITDSFDLTTQPNIDWTHANCVTVDPLDNNYLLSLRGFCQILKISRTTGKVIWRLGGKDSDFTFIGENPTNAPYYFIGQHNIHMLANGDILFFDNGNPQIQGSPPGRTYSRAVEYHLDETNMTATLVWEYRHNPDVFTPAEGIVKRFRNGDTFIGWVNAVLRSAAPTFTEVNASNQVMFELTIPGYKGPSIFTKQVWNSPALVHSDTNQDVAAGQVYNGTNSGVTMTVNSLTATSGNQLIVSKHDDAVRFAQFTGKAPQVLVQRVTLSATNISALSATLTFPLPPDDYCFDTPLYPDPAGLTVYQRPVVGQGTFTPMATAYDPVAKTLTVTNAHPGEFIFTYPDLPEIPIAPILFGQATQGQVDAAEPVFFQWTPKGFARSYHLQVATDPGFNNLVVDQSGLTNMSYTLASVLAGRDYFWRVNVSNYGGTSDWSSDSFAAFPPMIKVTAPEGGAAWRRGLPHFIQWTNNLSENISIQLYKGGTLLKTIATNVANLGAYYWSINYTNVPGSDYSIKLLSATNAAVFGTSAPFSIVDPPAITAGSVAGLPGGGLQFGVTAPGAATATVWDSTNLTTWQVLQILTVTNNAAVYTETAATNLPSRFYRVSVP